MKTFIPFDVFSVKTSKKNSYTNNFKTSFYLWIAIFTSTLLSQSVHAQNHENILYPSISKKLKVADFSFKLKTAVFVNFSDDPKPDLNYFQQAISFDVLKHNQIKLEASFVYRRYNVFDDNIENEYRPAQTIKISSKLSDYSIQNSMKFEQRFRDDYINRWVYKLQMGSFKEISPILPSKIANELLYSFNKDKTGYENRLSLTFSDSVFDLPVSIGLQHRMKNIFSDKDLNHLFVLKTDFSF